ncbi:hypothetical protein [Pseudomonas sp. C9-3]|uniref:hypothetical protein n=1 Tax=Pseudomonas sp. C9-3 TaxID=3078264 RepID=UPI0028E82DF8|nr:hypothetical protein [Pseudomonas sp. C9-3]
MTQLLPNGKQHFMNNNGQPLANGRVYHYFVGTNNPKDTFQDAAETIPNTNPIILNARGEAAIYGTGPYRQVLQNSAGVVIWDQVILDAASEVLGKVDSFIAELADTDDPQKGATLVPTAPRSFDDVVALGEYVGIYSGQQVTLFGEVAQGEDGDIWRWDATSAKPHNPTFGIVQPSGVLSGRWIRLDYQASAYSAASASVVSGPQIVHLRGKIKNDGAVSSAAYNNSLLQDIFSGLPSGAEVELPRRGYAYVLGGLTLDAKGISLVGYNSSSSLESFRLKFSEGSKDALTVTGYGFYCENVLFEGASSARGADVVQSIVNFEMGSVDCDAVFASCGFLRANKAVEIKNKAARNIKFHNCIFSNLQRAFSYSFVGGVDIRDVEIYDCRFHSIGLLGDASAAVVFIEPASNLQNVIIFGGLVDDSVEIFRGYASGTHINIPIRRGLRGFVSMDATGHGISLDRRICQLGGGVMWNRINPMLSPDHGIRVAGGGFYNIDGITISGAGGHGLYVDATQTSISNTVVYNASQFSNATYSGFFLTENASGTIFGSGCSYRQDRTGTAVNKARLGVENVAADVVFESVVYVDNLVGSEYYVDPTKRSRGIDPVGYAGAIRQSSGAAAPTTGIWQVGDIVRNTSGTSISHFRCTASGTPGTWVAIS